VWERRVIERVYCKAEINQRIPFFQEIPAVCMQLISDSLNGMFCRWKVTYRVRVLKVVKAACLQYYGEKQFLVRENSLRWLMEGRQSRQ